jgi:hypothetical protein
VGIQKPRIQWIQRSLSQSQRQKVSGAHPHLYRLFDQPERRVNSDCSAEHAAGYRMGFSGTDNRHRIENAGQAQSLRGL